MENAVNGLMNDRLFTTNYFHSWGDDEHGSFIPENAHEI
jgi:hypothetical protein